MTDNPTVQAVEKVTGDLDRLLATLPGTVTGLVDSVNIERWTDAHAHLVALQGAVFTADMAFHMLCRAGRIECLPDGCPIGGRT